MKAKEPKLRAASEKSELKAHALLRKMCFKKNRRTFQSE